MMIAVGVDEAYAFDMLCILEIKRERSAKDKWNFAHFLSDIRRQLGDELTSEIRASETYVQLLATNQKVFDLVERITQGEELAAKEVHDANMERFYLKRKLQMLFFGDDLNEQKTV